MGFAADDSDVEGGFVALEDFLSDAGSGHAVADDDEFLGGVFHTAPCRAGCWRVGSGDGLVGSGGGVNAPSWSRLGLTFGLTVGLTVGCLWP